jgi:integrase
LLALLRFLDDLGLGKVNRRNMISSERQLHYLNGLRVPLEFFNKPTRQLILRDVEAFEKALSSGQLRNKCTGQPYAHNIQVEMRKLLKIFLRWRLGPAKALVLTEWFDTHYRPKTPDFLKEAEIQRLYKHCRDARQRFLIAVLFDSGARAEEFHNLRFEDMHLPESNENFVKITLKQEYAKILGRTITLYCKHALEPVQDYLAERVAQGIKPAEPVFKGDYPATRKFLQRLGHSVLTRTVHYHLFRHSSTTY